MGPKPTSSFHFPVLVNPERLLTNLLLPSWKSAFGITVLIVFLIPEILLAGESALEAKLNLAKELSHSRPDTAILVFDDCIKVSRKRKAWSEYARCHLSLGILYAEQGDFGKALPLADTASRYFEKLKDLERLASTRNLQASILMNTGKSEEALQKYLSCISLAESQKNSRMLMMAYSNVSMLYLSLIQYDKALEYARKQYTLAISEDNRDEIAFACAPIIDLFSQKGKADSMEKYVNRMKWACEGTQDPSLPLILANETGAMLIAQKREREAILYFKKAAKLSQDMNDTESYLQSNLNMGFAFLHLKLPAEALGPLSIAYSMIADVGNPQKEMEIVKCLAEAHSGVGNFKEAYRYQLRYQLLSDEQLNHKTQETIHQMEAKYQSEKKEASIKLLNKDNALKASVAVQRTNERNLVLLSSLAILGFGLFFGNRYMARRKLASEKEVLESRLRLSADLHDDVGATLSSISIYTEAIKNKLKNNEPERVMDLVNKIGENSRETISTLGDIVWNLNPINDSAERLFNRMESTATILLSAQNTALDFQADSQLFGVDFSLEAKQNLYLIFKETINNAAKYAMASEVKVLIQKGGNQLNMIISDNGKGFDVEQKSEGNGLRNIRLRTEALNGSLALTSSAHGTKTEIQLPLSSLGKG